MADVVLHDRNGDARTYAGVESVELNTTDGGTQIFTAGTGQGKTVELDFSDGSMTVLPDAGSLLTSVNIPAPETLTPENVAAGVNIAGIIGTFGGMRGSMHGTFGEYTADTTGRVTVSHGLGTVPDFVLVKCRNKTTGLVYLYSMSDAFQSLIGDGVYGTGYCGTNASANCTAPISSEDALLVLIGFICQANAESFQVGGSWYSHGEGMKYEWIALALE